MRMPSAKWVILMAFAVAIVGIAILNARVFHAPPKPRIDINNLTAQPSSSGRLVMDKPEFFNEILKDTLLSEPKRNAIVEKIRRGEDFEAMVPLKSGVAVYLKSAGGRVWIDGEGNSVPSAATQANENSAGE
jgi:hypothetical protein